MAKDMSRLEKYDLNYSLLNVSSSYLHAFIYASINTFMHARMQT